MPRVGGKHFSYTKKGKKAAQAHAKRTKQPVESMYGGRLLSLLTEAPKKQNEDNDWTQGAEASIKRRGTKGKCTPITRPGCTGRARAVAMTFKKMSKKRTTTESDERRQDRDRRETIDNYIKSRRLETSWAKRTRRGGAPKRVQQRYSGPDSRTRGDRRNPNKPKSKASLSDIEKVLSNYSGQKKR